MNSGQSSIYSLFRQGEKFTNSFGNQRRIFIFRALGYFKLEALLEGLRRLMSYKSELHVFVTFTEQVVPIHEHITVLYSELPRYQEQKQLQ